MFCHSCGQENESIAQFCGGCGVGLSSPSTSGELELPRVGFIEAVQTCFQKYIDFSGRATRAEFWWFTLFASLISIITMIIDYVIGTVGMLGLFGLFEGLWALATFFPSLAVAARRLHDRSKSGWWQLLWLTGIGAIVLLVWYVRQGNKGENTHGPDPRTTPR